MRVDRLRGTGVPHVKEYRAGTARHSQRAVDSVRPTTNKEFSMHTRTGHFNIGFRRGWSDWQKSTATVIAFAKDNGFSAIDLGKITSEDASAVRAAGLQIGSVDLLDFGNIACADACKRADIRDRNIAYIKEAAALGAKIFFTVVNGESDRSRKENYTAAVDAFTPLAETAAAAGATIIIEGYPGGSPHYSMLCTTPETCRAILKDIPKGLSLNYDPSHLIRLGVDHIRFLREFAPHVSHVHGKDTERFPEALYEFGIYQPSAFTDSKRFAETTWRYTIPGQGEGRWTEMFKILQEAKYKGLVCIELEDHFFNGSEAGEKEGLLHGLEFLRGS